MIFPIDTQTHTTSSFADDDDGIPNKLKQFELEFLWRSSASSFSSIFQFSTFFSLCLFGGKHKWKMITDHFGRHEFWSIQCDKRTGKVTHLLDDFKWKMLWRVLRDCVPTTERERDGEKLALNQTTRWSMLRFKVKHHVSFSDLLIKIYVEWKMIWMNGRAFFSTGRLPVFGVRTPANVVLHIY